MTKIQIAIAVEAAARLLNENPSWTYKQAIDKAKEVIQDEEMDKVEKVNQRNFTKRIHL